MEIKLWALEFVFCKLCHQEFFRCVSGHRVSSIHYTVISVNGSRSLNNSSRGIINTPIGDSRPKTAPLISRQQQEPSRSNSRCTNISSLILKDDMTELLLLEEDEVIVGVPIYVYVVLV